MFAPPPATPPESHIPYCAPEPCPRDPYACTNGASLRPRRPCEGSSAGSDLERPLSTLVELQVWGRWSVGRVNDVDDVAVAGLTGTL